MSCVNPSQSIKTAGILGGMGPEATVDLLRRIIAHTEARDDADHVRCLVDQNPKVPSRIKALLEGGGESPGPCMANMAQALENSGADFLCIACNTAHNWHRDVADAVSVPVLNMVEIAADAIAGLLEPDKAFGKQVGILASPAVRLTRLYEEPCRKFGMRPVYADADMEQGLLDIIKDIKAGDTGDAVRKRYHDIVLHLENKGADALVVACTELGVIGMNTCLPVVDAADALARRIVREAGARERPSGVHKSAL